MIHNWRKRGMEQVKGCPKRPHFSPLQTVADDGHPVGFVERRDSNNSCIVWGYVLHTLHT